MFAYPTAYRPEVLGDRKVFNTIEPAIRHEG